MQYGITTSPVRYKQMVGRAGRAGHAARGDSYLLCESTAGPAVETMLRTPMPRVDSCLLATPRMKRLLLEGFGTGLMRTVEQVEIFLQATLLWHSAEYAELHACAKGCIAQLVEEGVIQWSTVNQEFCITDLGLATGAAGIESKEAKQTHRILAQAIDRGLSLCCNSGASKGFGATTCFRSTSCTAFPSLVCKNLGGLHFVCLRSANYAVLPTLAI